MLLLMGFSIPHCFLVKDGTWKDYWNWIELRWLEKLGFRQGLNPIYGVVSNLKQHHFSVSRTFAILIATKRAFWMFFPSWHGRKVFGHIHLFCLVGKRLISDGCRAIASTSHFLFPAPPYFLLSPNYLSFIISWLSSFPSNLVFLKFHFTPPLHLNLHSPLLCFSSVVSFLVGQSPSITHEGAARSHPLLLFR